VKNWTPEKLDTHQAKSWTPIEAGKAEGKLDTNRRLKTTIGTSTK